jgi:hypothetical protein
LCCKRGAIAKESAQFSGAQLQLLDVQAIMQHILMIVESGASGP